MSSNTPSNLSVKSFKKHTNFIPESLVFIMQPCLQETSRHSDSTLVQIRDPRKDRSNLSTAVGEVSSAWVKMKFPRRSCARIAKAE